jgi:hypothetical protein
MKNIENMTNLLFREIPLLRQSLMQRLLKQLPEDNAIIELNNLLANNSVKDISSNDVNSISKKYNTDLVKTFSLNLEEFYAVLLNSFLRHEYLSSEDADILNHVKRIFELDNKNVLEIHLQLGGKIFRQYIEKKISNGRLTDDVKKRLNEFKRELLLPENIANDILQNVCNTFFVKAYQSTIENNRVSPVKEEELLMIAKSLDINISPLYKTTLYRLKTYWSYENSKLEEIETKIKLQKNEVCYFVENNVQWYEERELMKRKYGYAKVDSHKKLITRNLKKIDIGTVVLTSKRLIFSGIEKNANIGYDKVILISEFEDSIEIDKQSGRNPILCFEQNTDIIYILLQRLMKEFN